ncbi:MAG: hypothetical protein HYZ26_00285 [Chloroflexi bacterium]|nr:hypothetical protein [Chloroflexota bacterium]
MAEKPRAPGMFQVFVNDLPRIAAWLRQRLNDAFNGLFSTSAVSGARRQLLFTLVLGTIWARAAFNAHPIQFSHSIVNDLLVYPFVALFSASIMRHVLVMVLVFLFGLRVAAAFLDDVFELNDVLLAERYILQAVFASQYDLITIKDGGVAPENRNSPVSRIGGPGRVKVHLENVALFEKATGQPNPIGPQDTLKARRLDRFERLRAVVDLREQTVSLNVRTRTKDGIYVTAQGAQILYSVARSRRKEPSLKSPMTYDREAIQKIVYGETVFKHFRSKLDKSPPQSKPPGGTIDLKMGSFIESQLKAFISGRFLSEFLTQTQEPEREKKEQDEETLRMAAEELAATQPAPDSDVNDSTPGEAVAAAPTRAPTTGRLTQALAATQPSLSATDGHKGDDAPAVATRGGQPLQFISRDEITRQFYEEVNRKALERGLQLHWIDIGTWVLPDEARLIARQHLDAWDLSVKNQTRGNAMALDRVLRESRNLEMLRLFRETPLNVYYEFHALREEDPGGLVRRVLAAYRERIRRIWGVYQDRGEEIPEEIDLVTDYLNRHLVHFVPRKRNAGPDD